MKKNQRQYFLNALVICTRTYIHQVPTQFTCSIFVLNEYCILYAFRPCLTDIIGPYSNKNKTRGQRYANDYIV